MSAADRARIDAGDKIFSAENLGRLNRINPEKMVDRLLDQFNQAESKYGKLLVKSTPKPTTFPKEDGEATAISTTSVVCEALKVASDRFTDRCIDSLMY